MSKKFKKILLIIFGIIAGIVIILALLFAALMYFLSGGKMTMPNDQQMISRFYDHQADFETLVKMSDEDSRVTRIAKDFTRLDNSAAWPRSDVGFSEERWNEYRRLFKNVNSDIGVDRSKDGSVYITTYAFGMVTGGDEKGYAYLQNSPENLVVSIDDSKSSARSNVPIYRHISGNWYLFYSWDD
jgi:hypothetical protein